MDAVVMVKNRLALLLEHLGDVPDPLEPEKGPFPSREVLFLVTCASRPGKSAPSRPSTKTTEESRRASPA